jgi:transposase
MATKVFVGVDVSKDNLDVAIGSEKQILTFANDQKGVDALIEKLNRIGPELIVFESTGGYERLAASLFVEAGLPVVIVNPRQVRDFAKSAGILAKTDAIDARVIVRFAAAVKPDVRQLKDRETSLRKTIDSNLRTNVIKKTSKIISDGCKNALIKSNRILIK